MSDNSQFETDEVLEHITEKMDVQTESGPPNLSIGEEAVVRRTSE